MALIFLWQYEDRSEQTARRHFQAGLNAYAAKASRVVKRDLFTCRTTVLGRLLAGIVDTDYGIEGFQPWCESATSVVLFSGVCESFLGKDPSFVADKMVRLLRGRHHELARLEGRFSAVVLDKARHEAWVVTGATDASSLWMTDGPAGWALGSRAAPLLRVVERRPELDPLGAGLLLSFGYLWGTESLFEGVSRVGPRTIVRMDRCGPPHVSSYLSLVSFLADCPVLDLDESVQVCAERLKERVSVELKHSTHPLMSLSGGVDSRSIAAAMGRGSAGTIAYSAGSRASKDVILATEVARKLGMPLETPGLVLEDVLASEDSLAQCEAWSELSEGMETIRHALTVPDLFLDGKPCLGHTVYQVFHGHGGNVHNGAYYRRMRSDRQLLDRPGTRERLTDIFRPEMPVRLLNQAAVDERFEAGMYRFAEELAERDLSLAQWFSLFYWQNRCLYWGSDMFAAKDLLGWHWVPLMDRELLRTSLRVGCAPWAKLRFMERLVEALAPQLARCPYTGTVVSGTELWSRRIKSLVPSGIRPGAARVAALVRRGCAPPVHPGLRAFWDEVFSQGDALDSMISRADLMRLVETNPRSEFLWNAATVALVARRHFDA